MMSLRRMYCAWSHYVTLTACSYYAVLQYTPCLLPMFKMCYKSEIMHTYESLCLHNTKGLNMLTSIEAHP
jgi:hypothetical protein